MLNARIYSVYAASFISQTSKTKPTQLEVDKLEMADREGMAILGKLWSTIH